jgi:hypothetical protein
MSTSHDLIGNQNSKPTLHKVHQRIVDPRVIFELFCDWLKTGHVVRLLVFDWIIPSGQPFILFEVLL